MGYNRVVGTALSSWAVRSTSLLAGKTRTALIMLGIGLTGLVCIGMGVLAAALDLDSPWGISVPFLIAFLVNVLFLPLIVWATIDLIVVLMDNFKDGQGRIIKRL